MEPLILIEKMDIYINYDKGTLKINTTLVTGYEVEKKLFSIQFETLIIKIKRF